VAFLKTWIFNTDIRTDRLAWRSEENRGMYGEGGTITRRRGWKWGGFVCLLSADSLQNILVGVSLPSLILMLTSMYVRTATSSNQIRWYSQGSYSQPASLHWSVP
jgi:hypothetical protein